MTDEKIIEAQWYTLTISDNYIFSKAMEFAPDVCIRLLELFLGLKIARISWIEREKSLEERSDSRGIRLDVYVEEKARNRVFNVEMQISNTRNLAKRIRYYQGMIDLDKLKRGENFSTLSDSYIVFVCRFDPFGKGRHIYTFRETCEEDTTVKLGDGTTKIFINTKGTMDDTGDDLKAFTDYVEYGTISGELIEKLDAAVQKVKYSLETRLEYMTLQLAIEERAAERAEKIAAERVEKARLETQSELVKNLCTFGMSAENIAKATRLTEAEIAKILASDTDEKPISYEF